MFRKEALRNQYKSSDIGRSLIKQPHIINNAILILIIVFIVSFFIVNTLTFSTNKNHKITVSSEHYTPLIYSQVVVINKHHTIDGEHVKKSQALISISTLSGVNDLKNDLIRSPSDGFFFHAKIEKNILKPFEPLGYLLTISDGGELSFWLETNKNTHVKVNDRVKLIVNSQVINGVITIVIGNKSNIQEQKIYIKLESANYGLLSPTADIEIMLTQQPKKVINLIK
jgi:hypothetical protein